MANLIQKRFKESADNLKILSENSEFIALFEKAVSHCVDLYTAGATIYIAGNGGSASDSMHMSTELVAKLGRNRTAMRAWSLAGDTAFLTAAGNDYGYDFVFSRQLEAHAKVGDIFLAITTSGNSKNIIKALEVARRKKCFTILLSGFSGGAARDLADVALVAPGASTPFVQEAHIVIYHTLCEELESRLVAKGVVEYIP